ncbi:uncharacterized protein LOC143025824 [Oratosquilla oratoria]|uniref:uncharacterized protein LOC143025824 n=1 Tax=Oratosquilla oratoria TaxID=337810 RepID=UPI003F774DDD
MDKSDYEGKATTLLQDMNTYEVVLADPIAKLQRKVEGELKKLKEARLITEREWTRMRPGDSTIPKFYGLPKVHKEGVPLRPIIAFRGSPTYNLARDLAKRLRPLVESSERMLSNSADFVERLRGVSLGEEDCLVSFDVKAMFTSLPQGLIRQAARSTMESNPEFLDKSKLTAKELMGLVDLCLDSTFFKYRDKIFHQKEYKKFKAYALCFEQDSETRIRSGFVKRGYISSQGVRRYTATTHNDILAVGVKKNT